MPPKAQPKEGPKAAKATTDKYQVPAGEENTVHALIEQPIFNQRTGEHESKPFIHKAQPREWDRDRRYLPTLGYVLVDMLHCPDGCKPTFGNPEKEGKK